MTIKDLIDDLSKLNPNSTVLFSNSLEMGRSFCGCSYVATHQLTDMDKDEFEEELDGSDIEDDDKEHLLDKVGEDGVVVFYVSGEETFCE
jgi:hypothetical protein